MTTSESAAGWHGKLPTVGDFATRRLEPDFVQAWDDWLSHAMRELAREPRWLDDYLASQSWRFLLMRGVLPGRAGETAWAGVLMPSVDRVGRYYPLTLAHPLPVLPHGEAEVESLWLWLLRLEEAAVDAMHDDWTLDQLETELANIGVPPVTAAAAAAPLPPPGGVRRLELGGHRHAATLLMAQAAAHWQDDVHGRAFWYAEGDLSAPCFLLSDGLDRGTLPGLLFGPVHDNQPPSSD